MSEIIVAGCNGTHISAEIRAYLADQRYPLYCARSLRDIVLKLYPEFNTSRWSSIVPLDECFAKIRDDKDSPVAIVLTSGDPLFYGLGKRLKEEFSGWKITFFPALSYMQSLFSHFGINWDDAEFVSLHGRPLRAIDDKLHAAKLFIYTDPKNTPDQIAEYLKNRLDKDQLRSRRLMIGECIGSEKQRFTQDTIDEISSQSFAQPNCLILIDQHHQDTDELPRFGLVESDVQHSRGLITKSEVRAAVIHRLRLPETGVFWDVGAGSGSISIEAARLYKSLSVIAVEKEKEQLANIEANVKKFGCTNVRVVSGEAPEALSLLPAPDCVFVGGSGGRLEEILNYISTVIKDHGRIVMTAVLEQTAQRAPEILARNNFDVEISLVQVTRYSYPEQNTTELNPIHIIHAEKRQI